MTLIKNKGTVYARYTHRKCYFHGYPPLWYQMWSPCYGTRDGLNRVTRDVLFQKYEEDQ